MPTMLRRAGWRTAIRSRCSTGAGRVELRAQIGDLVPAGVVAARLDWTQASGRDGRGGANVNALTSETLTDMGGGATFYSTLVEVCRAELRDDCE